MKLYSAVDEADLPSIIRDGLRPGSFWTSSLDLAAYYQEVIDDEELVPVLLTIDLEALDQDEIKPDYPGLEEPISTVIRMKEEEVWKRWRKTDQTWMACLDLIGSLKYDLAISADLLKIRDDENGVVSETPLVQPTHKPGIG